MQSQQKMGSMRMAPLILKMSLPAIASMLINALYNIVDSAFVARYSADALTAVSLVFPLQQLVIAVAVGAGIGVNSLMSRSLGAKDQEKAELAAEHGLALSVLAGLLFVMIGFFGSRPFLGAFTNNPKVLDQAVQYSYIVVGLSTFVMVYIMCEKIQQATGDMIVPMCQGLGGSIVNIVLDPLLIFGIGPFPELGIRGAAIATVLGQVVGMLIGLWGIFCHQKMLKIRLLGWKLRGDIVCEVYQVGLPSIIMQSISSVMIAGMNVILIRFSEAAVTVLGIYFKLQTFVFMPVFGLNQGSLPVMGYNFGARDRHRLLGAYRITVFYAVVIMMIGMGVFQVFPEPMIRIFSDPNNPQATETLVELGVPALRTISLSFVCASFGIINSTLFQAIGHGMASLLVSVCRQLFIILPVAVVLAKIAGLTAVWYAFPIAEIAAVILSWGILTQIDRRQLRKLVPLKEE